MHHKYTSYCWKVVASQEVFTVRSMFIMGLDHTRPLCAAHNEIKVGFPVTSMDEFDFVRLLIEQDEIPDDVGISVLVPARDERLNGGLCSALLCAALRIPGSLSVLAMTFAVSAAFPRPHSWVNWSDSWVSGVRLLRQRPLACPARFTSRGKAVKTNERFRRYRGPRAARHQRPGTAHRRVGALWRPDQDAVVTVYAACQLSGDNLGRGDGTRCAGLGAARGSGGQGPGRVTRATARMKPGRRRRIHGAFRT